MVRSRRLLITLLFAAWVVMVLACGGAGDQSNRPGAEPDKKTGTADGERKPDSDKTAGPKPEKPVPWKGKLGTGANAYDELPEPWRGRFVEEWRQRVAAQKEAVDVAESSFGKAKAAYNAAEQKLADFKKRYGDNPKDMLTLSVLKDRNTELAKAEAAMKAAEAILDKAKAERAGLEKNDPPYLNSTFDGCTTPEQIGQRVAEIETKQAAADAKRKEEEAKLKAEEEYDANGLVLLRKTVQGTAGEFGGEITGTVVNRRSKKLGYVQIKFILYDASGAQVGTALANINDLEPGARWNFKATSFGTKFKSYKFSELSGF